MITSGKSGFVILIDPQNGASYAIRRDRVTLSPQLSPDYVATWLLKRAHELNGQETVGRA